MRDCRHSTVKMAGNLAIHARMIPSLVFVPPHEAEAALDLLSAELPKQLSTVMDYFEHTYLDTMVDEGSNVHPSLLHSGQCGTEDLKTFPIPTLPWRVDTDGSKPMLADITPRFGASSMSSQRGVLDQA